jgi:hypothetical protein
VVRIKDRRRPFMLAMAALALGAAFSTSPAGAHARVPRSFFGMQGWDLKPLAVTGRGIHRLARMQHAGVGTVRMNVNRGVPTRAADRFVLAAARHRIRVMVEVADGRYDPNPGPNHGLTPPRHFGPLARYAAGLAHRYGSHGTLWRHHRRLRRYSVRLWQIWNEPNLPVYWRPKPNPRAYARAVRVVGHAIRRADHKAMVVSAGLPDSKQSRPLPVRRYLRRFLRAGGRRSVDAIALNGYSPTVGRFHRLLRSYRRIMNHNHARRLKILVTELGWADRGHRNPMVVGRRAQARDITRAYRLLAHLRRRWHIAGVFYFQWRDVRIQPGDYHGNTWGYHTGLLRVSGRHKPAYRAFRRVVHRLRR